MVVLMTTQRRCINMLQTKVTRHIGTWIPLCAHKSLPICTGSRTLHNNYGKKVESQVMSSSLRTTNLLTQSCVVSTFHGPGLRWTPLCTSASTVPRSYHLDQFTRGIHTTIFSRTSTTETDSGNKEDPITLETDFKEVLYQQSNMRSLYFANKLKIYQSLITVVHLPILSYVYICGNISASTLLGQAGFTLSLLGGLYYVSASFLSHVAGTVYINEAGDQLKIARMKLWGGKRQEDIVDVEDVVLFADVAHRRERFRKIRLDTGDDFYFVDKKLGRFPDKEKFTEIFGKL